MIILVEDLDVKNLRNENTSFVDWNRKPDTLGTGPDCDIDSDDFPIKIQQRAATVPRVDAGIGLNKIFIF